MSKISKLMPLVIVIILTAGCATQQPVQSMRFFWPQLPERPRVEWLDAYASELDFPKEGFAKFARNITGEDIPLRFRQPLDIRSDGNGLVYISDPGLASVLVYDLKNKSVRQFGSTSSYASFEAPTSLALDSAGNVYVNDVKKRAILVFTKDEKPLRSISTAENVQHNGGIAVDSQRNRLLVTDARDHKVVVFSLDGAFQFSFGKRGIEDGEFNYPVALTVNHRGEIIVGDAMNGRVQIFDAAGKFLRKFGSHGDSPSEFQILKDVAVDSDDNIYITDGKGHHIVIYSQAGEYLLTIGGLYGISNTGKIAPGGFLMPQGIDIDANDKIFVVDQLNLRFQVFQYLSDGFVSKHPIEGYLPRP